RRDADRRDLHSFPTRRSSDLGRDWPSKLLRRRCRVRSFGVWRDRGQEKRGPEDAEQGESRRAEDRNLEPEVGREVAGRSGADEKDRKSTRLNSSHVAISYAVF